MAPKRKANNMAKAKELWGSDEQDDDILDRFLKAKRFQVYVRTYCFVDFDKRKIQLYHVRLSYYWTTTHYSLQKYVRWKKCHRNFRNAKSHIIFSVLFFFITSTITLEIVAWNEIKLEKTKLVFVFQKYRECVRNFRLV